MVLLENLSLNFGGWNLRTLLFSPHLSVASASGNVQ